MTTTHKYEAGDSFVNHTPSVQCHCNPTSTKVRKRQSAGFRSQGYQIVETVVKHNKV